jgi:hypothetical protein
MEQDIPLPAEDSAAMEAVRQPFAEKVARFFQPIHPALTAGLIIYLAAIPFIYRFAAYQPLNGDPFLYGQVAKEMLAGKRLYSETWQDKPPLAFVPYMIPQALGFGAYPNFGFVLGVWLVIEPGIFFVFFRRNLPAALACVFFITLFPLTYWDFNWPSTEHFSNPFLAMMLLLALAIERRKAFCLWQAAAIGALMVIAFHIRQNAALGGLLALAAIVRAGEPLHRKIRALALFAAVTALCWGAIILWIWRIGDLSGYFYTVFEYPRLYARNGSYRELIYLVGFFLQTQLPLLLIFSAAIAALGGLRWPVIISLSLAIIMIMLPLRAEGHYFVSLFPFVAIYIALGLENFAIHWPRARWAGVWTVLLVGVIGAADEFHNVMDLPTYSSVQSLANTAEALAPPNATLLVCGEESLAYVSHLPAANTYSCMMQLDEPEGDILPKSLDAIFDDYLKHPPGLICMTDKDFNEIVDTKSPPQTNGERLIRMLASQYWYRVAAPVDGYHFLIRIPAPGSQNPQAP